MSTSLASSLALLDWLVTVKELNFKAPDESRYCEKKCRHTH